MERPATSHINPHEAISLNTLSGEKLLKLLQATSKSLEKRPILINELLLMAMEALYNRFSEQKEQENYQKTLIKAKQKLPALETATIYFPSQWIKQSAKKENPTYYPWDLRSQNSVTLILKDYAEIVCQKPVEDVIELYIKKLHSYHKHQEVVIDKLAHMIYECTSTFSNVVIGINPKTVNNYEALNCYLHAYQKIHHQFTTEHSRPIPRFAIVLQENTLRKINPPSEKDIEKTVEVILKKDTHLNNVYFANPFKTVP